MNNNFSNPNRITNLVIPVFIIMAILFIGNFVLNLITRDDYDDESITVEFHCPTVLSMKENYPNFVITECRRLYEK